MQQPYHALHMDTNIDNASCFFNINWIQLGFLLNEWKHDQFYLFSANTFYDSEPSISHHNVPW